MSRRLPPLLSIIAGMVDVIGFLSLPDDWAKIAGKKGERVARSLASLDHFSRALVRNLRARALPSIEPMACIWPLLCSVENVREKRGTARSIRNLEREGVHVFSQWPRQAQ